MRYWLGALLTVVFTQSPDLGPTDGTDLPPTDLDRVLVGESAPDFRLEDETGQAHRLSQYRGDQNVVLVFFRGHW